jgi:hypothetical protein
VLDVKVGPYRINIGDRFSVSFQRTRRLAPGDGEQPFRPPSSLGALPIHVAPKYPDGVPKKWQQERAVFFPISSGEAFWLGLSGVNWKPTAVKVRLGGIDAVTGAPPEGALHDAPQNYVVCPPQLALDGIYRGDGFVSQFAIAHQDSDSPGTFSPDGEVAIEIVVIEPKPGRFPEQAPRSSRDSVVAHSPRNSDSGDFVQIVAGATIAQAIFADPYGIGAWDQSNYGFVSAYAVSAARYRQITGLELPPPVDETHAYKKHRLP